MEIIIEAEHNNVEKPLKLIFTNDNLDNHNFVAMLLDNEEFTISVEDLFRVVKVFEEIRAERYKKRC